jgi:hypothetical protein
MLYMEARWKLLIGAREPGLVDRSLEHCCLKLIGEIGSLI